MGLRKAGPEEMAVGGLWGWQADVTGVVALLPVQFVLLPLCKQAPPPRLAGEEPEPQRGL